MIPVKQTLKLAGDSNDFQEIQKSQFHEFDFDKNDEWCNVAENNNAEMAFLYVQRKYVNYFIYFILFYYEIRT